MIMSVEQYRKLAPKKKTKRKFTESDLQISCVKWFDLTYPKMKMRLFSVPNEGARTPANGARMKAMGRRAGVADMFLCAQKLNFPIEPEVYGCFIEFKADTKQSDSQKTFEACVTKFGYEYFVCTSLTEFKSKITSYIK